MRNAIHKDATTMQKNRSSERRRLTPRLAALLLVLAAALAALLLGSVGVGQAQTSSLSVADFDQSGLQVVALASFTAGGATTLYSAADSRWGATGSLVEGGRRPERRFEDRAGDGPPTVLGLCCG